MAEDESVRRARKEWVVLTRPSDCPPSNKRKLESAERRLQAAIKHEESGSRLSADAERVRHAQLGCLKARDRVTELPTEVDDDPELQRNRANLAGARAVWESATVDEIVAYYAAENLP